MQTKICCSCTLRIVFSKHFCTEDSTVPIMKQEYKQIILVLFSKV